jgi:sulfite reductase alpha subunit-like flavoprotein
MQKDILFYSNLCEFCREVLAILSRNGAKEYFMMVCVDKQNITLPPFVDRVPLIYTTQKKLFADENLMNYIKSKFTQNTLQPYTLVGGNTGSYSENFSFIGEDIDGLEDSSRNYNILGIEQTIYLPESGSEENVPKKDNMLDKFMADRDADIKKIFGNTDNSQRL